MSIFQTPDIHKTSLTDNPVILRIWVQKPVGANLNRSVVGNGMNFNRTRHKFTNKLPTYVISSSIHHGFATDR